jgi:hypothetical protein
MRPTWYSIDHDGRIELHETAEEAEIEALGSLRAARSEAVSGEWPRDVALLEWGEFRPLGRAKCIPGDPEKGEPEGSEEWDLAPVLGRRYVVCTSCGGHGLLPCPGWTIDRGHPLPCRHCGQAPGGPVIADVRCPDCGKGECAPGVRQEGTP